ncbi:hypothetical protein CR513_49050, partial [Mucuna pruriens]
MTHLFDEFGLPKGVTWETMLDFYQRFLELNFSDNLEPKPISVAFSLIGLFSKNPSLTKKLTVFLGERRERHVRVEINMKEKRRVRHRRRGEEQREEEIDMTKCKIPSFLGNCKPEIYVDWELKVKKIMGYFNLHLGKVVRLVTL